MSGADKTDQAISTERPFVHNTKWNWPLFLYYLEVFLYNSWPLYYTFKKDCPFLVHVQSFANSYLNLHQVDKRVFKTEEIMFRNAHVAEKVDTLQFDLMEKIVYWNKIPLRCSLCGKRFQMWS